MTDVEHGTGGSKGYAVVADSLKACGVEAFFFLPGGPLSPVLATCVDLGMRAIDTRDERAAAFAAIAYSRVLQRPGVVMSAAGPGTTNTVTGVSHALADGAPIVAIGGSSSMYLHGLGGFQETDQVAVMRPITKLSHQLQSAQGIVPGIRMAFEQCMGGAPGPVYVDLPGDVIYADVDPADSTPAPLAVGPKGSLADPAAVEDAVRLITSSTRPVIIAGSGVLWSKAWAELKAFVEASGVPVFTTPIARGLVAEDHPLCLNASRTTAFRESDCVVAVGTRLNYVVNWLGPPVFSDRPRIVQVNINPTDMGHGVPVDAALLGDARLVLRQLTDCIGKRREPDRFGAWTEKLSRLHRERLERIPETPGFDESPIHPLRLCTALQESAPLETVTIVDGHEILGFSRQSLIARLPGHMLTPGAYGTMGVGVAFGVGAKVAKPDLPVVVLTGDGAFGFHAMELDTAVRHGLGIVVVVSNNGGWGGGDHSAPGAYLGYTDYHRIADMFGIHGTKVSSPDELGPAIGEALTYAQRERKPAILNVITSAVHAGGRSFSGYVPI